MEKVFKKLSDKTVVDLVPYVKDYVRKNPNVKIFVGTDSQFFPEGLYTIYATAVVLYHPGNGGHVIYSRERVRGKIDMSSRLWNEVIRSVEVAEDILANVGIRAEYIDLDLNPDPMYDSNKILRQAVGYVESMGYSTRIKSFSNYSIKVADNICR